MNSNRAVALLSIRLVLGLIFFFQGYGKIFSWGVENIYESELFLGAYKDLLPDFIIHGTAYYTSYIELLGGFILLFGFKTNYVLYALVSVLVIVTFGHGLAEPIWDLSHVMFRLILLVALLLLPREWDRFSLDHLLRKRS
ncbi:MAG: DoxX family protein [Crocinitomicaceae bacterium]|nr:DoxX family protein [Flavobacteriales bacterium]NQZ37481.1 DoxX family protein [Crocinitomicaceae bacterium]